jgi:hypothetical protein
MQGSTPQEKLFESMKDPATRGGTRIERQYTTDVSPKSKDYQDYYSEKSGDYRPLTVGLNPLQEEGYNLMGGYGRGRAEDLAFDAEKAMQESLGGGTGFTGGQERDILEGRVPMGAGTPYQAMADAFRQQSERGLQDTLAAQRQGLVQYQPGGSSVGNEIQARAIAENQQNINSQLAQMYGGAYKMAQDQRQPLADLMAQQQRAGMGAYPHISQQPMNLYQQMATGGGLMRDITQQGRTADIAAYEAKRARPGELLQDYLGNLGSLGTATGSIAGLLG